MKITDRIVALGMLMVAMTAAYACTRPGGPRLPPLPPPVAATAPPVRTVESVVAEIGPVVRTRVVPYFEYAGIAYPPSELALLAFKRERRLEIWARNAPVANERPPRWRRVDLRPILGASGGEGPKLRQGDEQVPEGFYRLVAFNPNSAFHLSMKIDYPNAFDLAQAEVDGRENLGGDIFIHGGARSIGCLAMGDRGSEDLFVLVADVGLERVQVIVAPRDPRGGIPLAPVPGLPFTADLYRAIADRLGEFSLVP